MSSSAPKRQPVTEASLFAYAEAELPGAVWSNGTGAAEADSALIGEERRRQQAEAFNQGRQSAQQQFRSDLAAAEANHREQLGQALQQFAIERKNYYRRIEGEVVELALAIARKVLHREVQIDPSALAGIVRVTLEKLDTGTQVNLHVHPKEAPDWRHYFACQMQGMAAPEVQEDPGIAAGECRLETSLGSTEMGLQSQLKEIETGLLDLLAERPDAGLASTSVLPAGQSRVPETR